MLCLFASGRCTAQAADDPASLRIQVLSGRTGRPVANQHLVVSSRDGKPLDGKASVKKSLTTDGEGYATIPNADGPATELSVTVDMQRPCSKTEKHEFSLTRVRASGVVSENSCRPRITMFPQPGTLIFFVRPWTWLERTLR